jgi:hypothetical protein
MGITVGRKLKGSGQMGVLCDPRTDPCGDNRLTIVGDRVRVSCHASRRSKRKMALTRLPYIPVKILESYYKMFGVGKRQDSMGDCRTD